MDDRLATIDTARKVGAAVSISVGELGPHLTQCRMGRCLSPYQVPSWTIQPFGKIRQRYRQTAQRSHSIERTVKMRQMFNNVVRIVAFDRKDRSTSCYTSR